MKNINTFTNRILWGDCIEVMQDLPDRCVDLVVTDPPYLVSYTDREGRRIANDDNSRGVEPAFAEVYRVLKPDSFCICFYGWNHAEKFLDAWKKAGFTPVGHFVWVKPYASKVGFARACHEQAYLLAKGHPRKPVDPPSDVLDWRYTGNKLHPTQKPVEALLPLIEAYSRRGDVVLDPFSGSGTTAVAARQLGRQPIGIEMDWNYCCVANERLMQGGK